MFFKTKTAKIIDVRRVLVMLIMAGASDKVFRGLNDKKILKMQKAAIKFGNNCDAETKEAVLEFLAKNRITYMFTVNEKMDLILSNQTLKQARIDIKEDKADRNTIIAIAAVIAVLGWVSIPTAIVGGTLATITRKKWLTN